MRSFEIWRQQLADLPFVFIAVGIAVFTLALATRSAILTALALIRV